MKGILVVLFALWAPVSFSQGITNAVRTVLRERGEGERRAGGIVVGLVDERGASVISFGRVDGDKSVELDGDTLFEIGSVTKTFTAILLQDMVDRGEMRLKDPARAYLPTSVKLPSYRGKEITLLDLATQTSGLPREPDNLDPKTWKDPLADYSLERFYDFLSRAKLEREPGSSYEYSNVGFALLGHLLALKAGCEYESLLLKRICDPLKMESTRAVLSPESKRRSAVGHDWYDRPINDLNFQVMFGNGAIHSSANDMLKFLAANLGLMPSPLEAIMKRTHAVRFSNNQALGSAVSGDFIFHNGGSLGASSFAGIDVKGRRGVVILSNQSFDKIPPSLGFLLLKTDWTAGSLAADQLPKMSAPRMAPKFIEFSKSMGERMAGVYRFSSGREITLRARERSAVAKFSKDIGLEIGAVSENRLACDYLPLEIELIRDVNGTVTALNVTSEVAEPELTGKALRTRRAAR
jgi:D-alanyl-D-alanine-carboxypeptidase/D-alanyl-D-alanine-endopeptidase